MSRVTARHGSSDLSPFKSKGGGGNSFFDLLRTHRLIEHDQWSTVAHHLLGEKERTSQHGRNMEFHGAVQRHAQPGTEVSFQAGDVATKYTKKTPKARVNKTAPTGTFSPIKMAEEPQIEPPAASSPSAAKPAGPSVGRDARGRAVSLKNQPAASKSASKPKAVAKPRKAAPVKSSPTVGRDPKTGRARSLKKQ